MPPSPENLKLSMIIHIKNIKEFMFRANTVEYSFIYLFPGYFLSYHCETNEFVLF